MACLYLLHHLVAQYGKDDEVTRCLDTRVFYVCPRLNPDGAEWALADVPKIIRSSTRPYPYDEDAGRRACAARTSTATAACSRCACPTRTGRGRSSERDPRLMVRRDPTETGGRYYRLLPEGRSTARTA